MRGRRTLAAGVLAVMALFCALRFEMRMELAEFMPAGGDRQLAALARYFAASGSSRELVLTIGAADPDVAVAAAEALSRRLRGHPEVARVRTGVDPELAERVLALYYPHRHGFLFENPEREAAIRLSDAALERRAAELRRRLEGPLSPFLGRIAPGDPLLATVSLLDRIRAGGPRLDLHRGHFVTPDGSAVIFATTRASISSADRHRALQADLRAWSGEIRRDLGEPLTIEQSSAGRFAARIQASMQRDVATLLTGAIAGVGAIFLLAFRSLRVLAIAFVPPLAGALCAATLGLAVFGALDGLAVAFGLSLVGVSIDYSIHLLSHRAFAPQGETPVRTWRRLRPSLLLGAATTTASLVGLGFSRFPGFQQVGLLATTGVASALAAAFFFVRDHPVPGATRVAERFAGALGRGVGGLRRRRRLAVVPAGLAIVAGAFALPRITWIDDLRELTVLDEALVAEEERVRERVAQIEGTRFAVVVADDPDLALARNDRLAGVLADAVASGDLEGFRSLHRFLWSPALQRANERALRRDATLPQRLDRVYAAAGFRRGAFQPFAEALRAPPPAPLTLDELLRSPLADAVRPSVADLSGDTALITHFVGLREPGAVRRAVESVEGARFFDQRRFVRNAYASYRQRTLTVVGWGYVAVFVLLFLRYRRLRESVAAFLPSALVGLVLAALAAGFGVRVNLMHLIGLVLVLGMGVDYGIFLVDSRGDERRIGVTLASLLLSCLTTLFMLGLLALSEHPILRALGLTAAVGVVLAFALAPIALLVAPGEPARPSPTAGASGPDL